MMEEQKTPLQRGVPAVIVRNRGAGRSHKYFTQHCRLCRSDLEIAETSLQQRWAPNFDEQRRELQKFFYCPVCQQWNLFSYDCRVVWRSDSELASVTTTR